MQYHPLMSSITNYSSQCSIIPLCPVLQNTAASAVSSPSGQYYKLQQPLHYILQQPVHYHRLMSSISKHRCCPLQILSATITQSSETLLPLPQYNLTATFLDCMQTQQCPLLLKTYTFVGCVTGSLHHNVTRILFQSPVNHNMICVQMRHEC